MPGLSWPMHARTPGPLAPVSRGEVLVPIVSGRSGGTPGGAVLPPAARQRGGQHRELPLSLRIGSLVSIAIYAVIATVVLTRGDVVSPSFATRRGEEG
jgi:hypothetical protein